MKPRGNPEKLEARGADSIALPERRHQPVEVVRTLCVKPVRQACPILRAGKARSLVEAGWRLFQPTSPW
jgi:hypothetical protein